jgi:integrase
VRDFGRLKSRPTNSIKSERPFPKENGRPLPAESASGGEGGHPGHPTHPARSTGAHPGTDEGVQKTQKAPPCGEAFLRSGRDKIKKSTIQLYKNSKKHLESYRRKKLFNATLEFQDLDKDFFINFIKHLSKDLEQNTVNKVIKQIRTVLNDAKNHGVEVNMEYRLSHTQVPFTSQPKVYLDVTEIDSIMNVPLETFSRLDKVRDLFLIGIWTGLRFSDFIRVKGEHLSHLSNGKEVLKIKTKKTNTFVTIPLKEVVSNVLDKYEGNPPKISEQKFNKYIKELCQLAGVNRRVSRIEKGEQVFHEKWELVSSHICRRSFATNSFKAGIHPKYIMPITGHKTVKQFMDYICIDEEESVELVSDNPFFK